MTLGWGEGHRSFAVPGESRGNLADWSAAANMLFASGCEAQAFALLCSFAAPLMSLFVRAEGGAVVSIIGGRKAGKSVAMAAAGTVWAMPDALILKRGRERFDTLRELRHLPVLTATLAHLDPKVAEIFIRTMLLSDKWWSTLLLHFGTEPIRQLDARIIELDLCVPRGLIAPDKDMVSALERRLLDNRGAAGAAYIAQLTTRWLWIKRMLTKHFAMVMDETGAQFEQRFTVRAITACWVAGIICAESGILEFSPERIARWSIERLLPKKVSSTPRPIQGGATIPANS